MANLTDSHLIALAIDGAENKVQGNYSVKDASDKIREAMIEHFGTSKLTYREFRNNKNEFFEFVEETVTPLLHRRLEDTFNAFAEVRSLEYGDMFKFNVPNNDLFKVATIAEGSTNIRRKRLEGTEFTVETGNIAVGIYEELVRFLAGRVDWAAYIDKMARSFERDIALRISNALYGSYDSLSSTYAATVSAGDEQTKETVLDIAAHVEAEHGSVVILGTRSALSKLKPEYSSDAQDGRRNELGYFGIVDGYDTLAIPQFHHVGTDEFAIDDKTLLILPQPDEKIVKVVLEGTALVMEVNGRQEDLQVQYDVIQRVGVLALTSSKYGVVKLS